MTTTPFRTDRRCEGRAVLTLKMGKGWERCYPLGQNYGPRPLWSPLMAEQSLSGEHHRHVVLIRRRDHLGVADGAARLRDESDARFGRLVDPVAEGEVGVRSERCAGGIVADQSRLVDREKGGVDPRHLAGADAD